MLREVRRELYELSKPKDLPDLGTVVGDNTFIYFAPIMVDKDLHVTTLADMEGNINLSSFNQQFSIAPYKVVLKEEHGAAKKTPTKDESVKPLEPVKGLTSLGWGKIKHILGYE